MTAEALVLWLMVNRPNIAAAYALRFSFQAAVAAQYRASEREKRLQPILRRLEDELIRNLGGTEQ